MPETFVSERFGEIAYTQDDVLSFPRGLPAFENSRSWVLVGDEDNAIKWLQNIEDGALALPVTTPDAVMPDYNARIPEDELELVGSMDPSDLALLIVVSIPEAAPWNMTANLRAPILLNLRTHRAVQVIALRAPRRAPARPAHRLVAIPRAVATGPGIWAVGGDDARPLPVPRGSVLVVGPPGSGRTMTLGALRRCLHEAREEVPLVVDDLDMAEAGVHAQVEEALRVGRVVLASASTDRTAGTYRGPLATLRERGDLVVLWPGVGPSSQVAGRSLRSVTDPRALTLPGRGALVSRASALPLQVADETGTIATGNSRASSA